MRSSWILLSTLALTTLPGYSNYPVIDVTRAGLRLSSLMTEQRSAAMHFVQTILSLMGYQKVLDIMGSGQAPTDAGTNLDRVLGGATWGLRRLVRLRAFCHVLTTTTSRRQGRCTAAQAKALPAAGPP